MNLGPVFHIVRRFEPKGGMETYVWKLTHALQDLGVDIRVICEMADNSSAVPYLLVNGSKQRRRWKSMRDFRSAVREYVEGMNLPLGTIVHSHERTDIHQVTTIHGPLIGRIENQSLFKRLTSQRVRFWCEAEFDEICGSNVKAVLPVSDLSLREILNTYPEVSNSFVESAPPGLDEGHSEIFKPAATPLRIVFAGREWKRKGLPLAIEICRQLNLAGLKSQLDVFGVPLQKMYGGLSWLSFKGEVDAIPFGDYDLLVHPARSEPYGMVIAEALVAGCRVLTSDRVGATMLKHPMMCALGLQENVGLWVAAAQNLALCSGFVEYSFPTWMNLAEYHCDTVYPRVVNTRP